MDDAPDGHDRRWSWRTLARRGALDPRRAFHVLLLLVGLLAAVVLALAAWLPGEVDRRLNRVTGVSPGKIPHEIRRLHGSLRIVDMHADSLLWGRDLVARHERGHVDLPRLFEGNVALQMFTIVTSSPLGMNLRENSADALDSVTLLGLCQGWPPDTWRSRLARVQLQISELEGAAARSDGRLGIVRRAGELRQVLDRRARGELAVGAVLGVEGAHALEGDVRNVDALAGWGVRMIGLAHFFDNRVGGSAHGVDRGGLTAFGRQVVERMEARGMLVDLAHASAALFDDVIEVATQPVVVSHTGVRGTCDNRRNLTDAQLGAVAGTGGLVGIGFWPIAVCGDRPRDIARAIRHAVGVVGVEHVALGSDFDGSTRVPFDAAGMIHLTAALHAEGFEPDEIRRIMGENMIELLLRTLPE